MTETFQSAPFQPAPFQPRPDCLAPDLPIPVQMVILARALWREGYDDHLAGHITVRRDDGLLWCNPWFLTWEEFGPDDVIVIDLDGNVVEGRWPVPLGIPLHLALHRARPNTDVALHHHARWGTVWADARRVPPVHDQSAALGGGSLVVIDEYSRAVNDFDTAVEVVAALGDADMALLGGHGVFLTAGSIRAIYQRAVALEWRCRVAYEVESLGGGPELPDYPRERLGRSQGEGFHGFWEAAIRRELRADPALARWARPT